MASKLEALLPVTLKATALALKDGNEWHHDGSSECSAVAILWLLLIMASAKLETFQEQRSAQEQQQQQQRLSSHYTQLIELFLRMHPLDCSTRTTCEDGIDVGGIIKGFVFHLLRKTVGKQKKKTMLRLLAHFSVGVSDLFPAIKEDIALGRMANSCTGDFYVAWVATLPSDQAMRFMSKMLLLSSENPSAPNFLVPFLESNPLLAAILLEKTIQLHGDQGAPVGSRRLVLECLRASCTAFQAIKDDAVKRLLSAVCDEPDAHLRCLAIKILTQHLQKLHDDQVLQAIKVVTSVFVSDRSKMVQLACIRFVNETLALKRLACKATVKQIVEG